MDLNWPLLTLAMAVLVLVSFFWRLEKSRPSAKEIAVLATLAALAALGRVPFAAIPNVQPTTFLVLISGYVFGSRAGFTVGVLAALTSNFFLGLGPWAPWQMLAWGLAGLTAGWWGRLQSSANIGFLVIFAVAWGYLYGAIMNLWHWLTFIYPLNWQTFAATYATAIWFDTLHGLGNGVFMWLMGKEFIKILQRYKKRMVVKTIVRRGER
ncbi:ECF transporter S component [Peptococcaceae bacterium 1198_IL3148]